MITAQKVTTGAHVLFTWFDLSTDIALVVALRSSRPGALVTTAASWVLGVHFGFNIVALLGFWWGGHFAPVSAASCAAKGRVTDGSALQRAADGALVLLAVTNLELLHVVPWVHVQPGYLCPSKLMAQVVVVSRLLEDVPQALIVILVIATGGSLGTNWASLYVAVSVLARLFFLLVVMAVKVKRWLAAERAAHAAAQAAPAEFAAARLPQSAEA